MSVLVVPSLDGEEWPTLGPQVCAFLEERSVYGPGDLRGDPYVVDDETRALVYRAYEVYPKGHPRAGKRRFKRVGWSLRKGTAKTEKAAELAYAELHPEGPVRCDGFDARGEPVGVAVRDPYIPMVAYTEEQTEDLAYAALLVICTEGPDVDLFDSGLERIMRVGGDGKAVALASSPDSRDGARTTFQHFDETHRFVLPRLKEAHQTMLANVPKRPLADPWSLETTTAPQPGEGSVAESTHRYARLVADGKTQDRTLFYFHRESTPKGGEDLSDPEQIRAAVIEASGPVIARWPDFEGQVEAIVSLYNQPDTDRSYWERVWLNRQVQSARQAFDPVRWEQLTVRRPVPAPGVLISVGFDGSRWRDATALIGTEVASGWQWPLAVWERPLDAQEWEVPTGEVDAVVDETFGTWDVGRLYGDPAQGWGDKLAEWAAKYGAQRVIEFYTDSRSTRKIATACVDYGNAVKAGDVTHGGDQTFARHIANARKRDTRMLDDQGQPLWVLEKERPDSPFKVDAAMAGTLSWQARRDLIAAGLAVQTDNRVFVFRR